MVCYYVEYSLVAENIPRKTDKENLGFLYLKNANKNDNSLAYIIRREI